MDETAQPSQSPEPAKKTPTVWLLVVVIIVIFAVFYASFTKKAASPKMHNAQPSTTQQMTGQPTVSSTSPSSAATTQITVIGNEFSFTPAAITVKSGQPVQIIFKNGGKYPHNFTISELNIQTKTIHSGEEDTVTFTPGKTGNFTYVCTVPGHEDRGMKGTLTVQ